MTKKDTDNKIPIYQLKSKEKVLDYYVHWTKEGQFNKDMTEWNYQAPQNTIKLFDRNLIRYFERKKSFILKIIFNFPP